MPVNNIYPNQVQYPTNMAANMAAPNQMMKTYFMEVANENVVQSYPIAPGNIIWFIDTTHKVIYSKACDFQGVLQVKVYDMTERVPVQQSPASDTQQSDLLKDLEAIKAQLAAIVPIIEELKG